MKNLFALSLLFLSLNALSQIEGELNRVEHYQHDASTQNLPVSIDLKGNISFNLTGGTPNHSFVPGVGADFQRTTINYVSPILFEIFALEEAFPFQPWIEYRTARRQIGVSVDYKAPFQLGILPYRGSFERTVMLRSNDDKGWRSTSLPRHLQDLNQWTTLDSGEYETYGGVMVEASVSIAGQRIIRGEVGIQNNFIVSLKKATWDDIELTVREENVKSRRVKIGPSQLRMGLGQVKGNLFQLSFKLKLSNPEHHLLYQKALQGRIVELQQALATTSQSIIWSGRDRSFYFGIPSIAGEQREWWDFTFPGDEGLYIRQKLTKGFLTKHRDHKTYVHHSPRGVVILWASKMKKVSLRELEAKFITRAQRLHLQGFEQQSFVSSPKLGNLITEVGIALTKEEFSQLTEESLLQAEAILNANCAQRSDCSKARSHALVNRVRNLLKLPWNLAKRDMGVHLSKQPSLIYALIKSMNWDKKAYVKFLSQKYQSLEGTALVVL